MGGKGCGQKHKTKRKRKRKHNNKRNRKRKRERKRQHKRKQNRDANPNVNPKWVGKDATKRKITRRWALTKSNPIISLDLLRADPRDDRRATSALNRCAPIDARYWPAVVAPIGAPIGATVNVYINISVIVNVNINLKLG